MRSAVDGGTCLGQYIVTKQKSPVSENTGGEAAYSSVSVMDDAAKDALSQVKLPMTNHHG